MAPITPIDPKTQKRIAGIVKQLTHSGATYTQLDAKLLYARAYLIADKQHKDMALSAFIASVVKRTILNSASG